MLLLERQHISGHGVCRRPGEFRGRKCVKCTQRGCSVPMPSPCIWRAVPFPCLSPPPPSSSCRANLGYQHAFRSQRRSRCRCVTARASVDCITTRPAAASLSAWAVGSGPRYMIRVTLFWQKRATKSDTSGHCLVGRKFYAPRLDPPPHRPSGRFRGPAPRLCITGAHGGCQRQR